MTVVDVVKESTISARDSGGERLWFKRKVTDQAVWIAHATKDNVEALCERAVKITNNPALDAINKDL